MLRYSFLFFLLICAGPALPEDFEFVLISNNYGITYLQINANIPPCKRTVVETLYTEKTYPDTIVTIPEPYDIYLALGIRDDSVNYDKNIYQERIIKVVGSLVGWQWGVSPFKRIFLDYEGMIDTITDFGIVNNCVRVDLACPAVLYPICSPITVSDADSLLDIVMEKYQASSLVYIMDSVLAGYDTVYTEAQHTGAPFNRHDFVTYERFDFTILEDLKGSYVGGPISFRSGNRDYHYVSSGDGSPLCFDDSIRTSGSNVTLKKLFYCGDYPVPVSRGVAWLVFDNPEFPNKYCPYYISTGMLLPEKPCISSVVPIKDDTLWFNDETKLPLQLFRDEIQAAVSDHRPATGNKDISHVLSYQNPFRDFVVFRFIDDTQGNMGIFNKTGRLIRRLHGRQNLLWDGTDDAGNAVPSGVYYLQAVIDGHNVTGRIVRIKND